MTYAAIAHQSDPNTQDLPSASARSKVRLGLALLAGCLLFVVARTMASVRDVHLIDRFDLWLLGMIPLIVLMALPTFSSLSSMKQASASRFNVLVWILSLVSFIILKEFQFFDLLELPLLRMLNFSGYGLPDFALCLMLSSSGLLLSALYSRVGRSERDFGFSGIRYVLALLIINWAMLFVTVFWDPFV